MSLKLEEPGSLEKPGPIGRSVRLVLGILCLYGLYELFSIAPYFVEEPIDLLPNLSIMILLVFCIFNYVVNIGFSRDWKRYPLIFSLVLFVLLAAVSYFAIGSSNSPILGIPILLWLGYFYAHLGISFVLASVLGTPGCEMRAIPQLFGKLTHRESKEHHCPVSIISGIDNWERHHFGKNVN
jgi:hypothetical protein